jgi:hypothetical protein
LRTLINIEIVSKRIAGPSIDTAGLNDMANTKWDSLKQYQNNDDIDGLQYFVQIYNERIYSESHELQDRHREFLQSISGKKSIYKWGLIGLQILGVFIAFYEKQISETTISEKSEPSVAPKEKEGQRVRNNTPNKNGNRKSRRLVKLKK